MKNVNDVRDTIFKTLLGVLFALGTFDILYSFTGAYAPYGLLYPASHVLLTIILFLSLSFIWYREQWALFLYAGVILAYLGVDFFVGAFHPAKLLLLVPLPAFLYLWKGDQKK
jgi:hypothetical protein